VRNILLIEPDYKNKYPPLGLMKISTYHKKKGDSVIFYKGFSPELRSQVWDRIYISTLFTFHWNKTIKTIKYYRNSSKHLNNIFVGGVMATLLGDEIRKEININVIKGLLDQKGKLGYSDDDQIDCLLPDYSILDHSTNPLFSYKYPTFDSYFVHATRGCIHRCKFCAVPYIEPTFFNALSIFKQIDRIRKKFGDKRNLLIMDNNILASDRFTEIIDEIKESGFKKGAKLSVKKNCRKTLLKRTVDFNQGVDVRLLNPKKMKLISEIAIEPLRIAFDFIKYEKLYKKKVWLAAEYGIKNLSNYILFNYKDTPEDFYKRLQINIELNEEFEKRGFQTKIWSFPMKFSPISGKWCKRRDFVGKNWNKKYLRGIQCILLATHGVVGPKRNFFEAAFGKSFETFKKIITLPEAYIIYREEYEKKRKRLEKKIRKLSDRQKENLTTIILQNNFKELKLKTSDKRILDILKVHQ